MLRILCVVVLVLAAAGTTDSLLAARTEHAIAEQVREHAGLAATPRVYIQSLPFIKAQFTQVLPETTVGISDISVPTFGLVQAFTVARDTTVTREQLRSGDLSGARAAMVERNIALDGVSLGDLLGIADLDISNPYNISPGGSIASEAQLRGTPSGYSAPVTIKASLRLDGPTFRLQPTQLIDAQHHPQDQVYQAFTLEFDTRTLPLSKEASFVYLSGGMIFFQTQEHNVILEPGDLSPIVAHPNDVQ